MFRTNVLVLVAALVLAPSILNAAHTTTGQTMIAQKVSQLPLAFTQNQGQWDDHVLFRVSSGGATMWFTKEGVTYQFTRHVEKDVTAGHSSSSGAIDPLPRFLPERDSVEQVVITTKFVGAKDNPQIVAEGLMGYKCNYFIGNDPSRWQTDVPNYESIMLKNLYPGIDLKYAGNGSGEVAYEFIVAPGADLAQVKLEFKGAAKTSIDAYGNAVVTTKWGDMAAAIKSPSGGVLSGIAGFSQLSDRTIGLRSVGSGRQVQGALAVQLAYSTYLGGSPWDDHASDIAIDAGGNPYVIGYTSSSNFPTQNPYDASNNGSFDVFVTKLSSSGNSLIYSTYLGGNNFDWGLAIAVDGSGNAYVTGSTISPDFPIQNPYQTQPMTGDYYYENVFVTKLSNSGNSLIYSTYLGGEKRDYGNGIAIDGSGYAYVTGSTASSNFPTQNPYQLYQGPTDVWDVFVTKLSSSGNSLIYSTYLGGGSFDAGHSVAVDHNGNAYVTGYTQSSNFPTLNPFQATLLGGSDAFVTKLSSAGNSLAYSTYLGGSSDDNLTGKGHIVVDGAGSAYITGYTMSVNFPTSNPFQSIHGGGYYGDAFVAKLSSSGNGLIYSTYLGGGGEDYGFGIAIDGEGNAYVTGSTQSVDFPTLIPYQSTNLGGYYGGDVFVAKFAATGNNLIYSTYLGGTGDDGGYGIAVDGSSNAYVAGFTQSTNFPTLNPYQTMQGGGDAFVTKLFLPPSYVCGDANADAAVDISDVVYLIAYIFSGGPAPNPEAAGDANCDLAVDISDAVYLIAYIFAGGPAPCAGCK